jgi:nucleotide-binding universal stress UspA family protein
MASDDPPPNPPASSAKSGEDAPPKLEPHERLFLVVVDETEEMKTALYYAARRALRTGGRVAMLYVIEPPEFQHWLGVERVMEDEARTQAEQTLQGLADQVQRLTGKMPVLHLRQGRRRDELLDLINEEQDISVLVLGTAVDHEDPGPLATYLIGQMGRDMRLPIILVPGHLSDTDIDAMT